MAGLPETLFLNPVWHALHGPHRHLAVAAGAACRYPADVSPFAAVAAPSAAALEQLRSLLDPQESTWIVDYGPLEIAGLSAVGALECVQMVLPRDVTPREPTVQILALSSADAPDMLALTDLTFPGFFRKNTPRMGSYVGVRVDGELVAMGGERLRLDGYPELSGICTHPAHRGKGFASNIIRHLARRHRREGVVSWLHVGAANISAIELYIELGFERVRNIVLRRVLRVE